MTPERAFLVLALALGAAIGVLLPPAAAPDEAPHLARIWVLAEGRLLPPGPEAPPALIPRSIPALHREINGEGFPPRIRRRSLAETRALLAQPLAREQRTRLLHGGAYPPVVYAPALAGVAVGRALDLSPGWLIYLARATGLAAWIALVGLAIRLCPLRKWTLVALATTPMSLAIAASVSADAMTNGAALLFVAVVMRSAVGRSGLLGRRELGALLGAALLLGFVKSGYGLLAATALAIPPARCGGRGRWLALAAAIGLAAITPSALWLAAVQATQPPPASPGADTAAQLRHVLGDPLGFAQVLISTTRIELAIWYRSFVGVLGLFAVPLPQPLYWAWAALFAFAAAADGPQPAALTPPRRALLLAVFAASVVATLVLGYLGWNPVGATHLKGMQGRYFIPAAPLLFLALPSLPRALPRRGQIALVAGLAASGVVALAGVLARYYAL